MPPGRQKNQRILEILLGIFEDGFRRGPEIGTMPTRRVTNRHPSTKH
jgi:hypothetical protein